MVKFIGVIPRGFASLTGMAVPNVLSDCGSMT